LFARLRIAQLAAAAASAVPGVERLEAGRLGRHMTSGAGQRVDGLVVGALSDARYESTSAWRAGRCGSAP